jgi:7,8-dihydropterin-6-yl-methyl-4-(beta-D-ribofuranosyl)aminobenzene 5'-phosphate synthase
MITILEVYNNILFRPVITAAFGFSCYLQESNLLFDTGGDGTILLENLARLNINPDEIQIIVLSHDHGDHTGGMDALLARNPEISVFIHDGFGARTKARIQRYGIPHMVYTWERITDDVFSTGPLCDGIGEQSLAISVRRGFLIISGCAHPHIGMIIRSISNFGPVWGAIGGFHTVSDEDVESLERLEYVSPSHCTQHREQIQQRCKDNFSEGGGGRIHKIETP